jgi:flagellar hook-associated protein 1 FlgK
MNEGLDYNGNTIVGLDGSTLKGHINAYGYEGDTGLLLFTYMDGKGNAKGGADDDFPTGADGNLIYDRLNCLNFAVNPQLLTSDGWMKLGCSSVPTMGESHNDVILGFQKLNSYPGLFNEGKLLDFIIGMSDHMAIDRAQAKNFDANYEEIVMQTDNQRLSVSGVNISEEMVDLVKFQQLYQACAKLVNVINEIYDTMINRLGAF